MKVKLSSEDVAAMENDLVMFGTCFVKVTRPGDIGVRLDPAKVKVLEPAKPKRKDRPEPSPEKSQTYVYFVSDGSSIKIGISVDPESRVASLQTSHPSRLVLLGTQKGDHQLERHLHARFCAYRQLGEWFQDTPAIREHIANFADQIGHKSQTELSN